MRPSFQPRMVNGPFEDPGLIIPFAFEKRAILFDLGEIYTLWPRDVLKISHVFVTHTHIDHFAGFDRLLRLMLGREKILSLYGPRGFSDNVRGKLAAYSWNLTENYTNRFELHVNEVLPDQLITAIYPCRNKFQPVSEPVVSPFDGILVSEPAFTVSAVILDHQIPCLGFSIKEPFHVNIIKESLERLGLEIGPWLRDFKNALFEGRDPDSVFGWEAGEFRLGTLAEEIACVTPGQKITYITDVRFTKENADRIISFAKDSDMLFIEAAFLEEDRELAYQKYHLTARQAGMIAGMARVKQFFLFHFSPRYTEQVPILQEEAIGAYVEAGSGKQEAGSGE